MRHRCSRFPETPSSCPASKGRAVVARQSSTRTMGGPRSLRRVGSLRAFALSSSNVPSWVVARLLLVESRQVAFRRRLNFRPFGPSRPLAASGPPQAGGLRRRQDGGAAEGMAHDAPSTAPPGAHCCAYAPNDARPAADFPECAPMGAHTAKSNLVRPSAAHRCRMRRGGRAAGLGGRFVPSPRPSLRGKGARGHESAAAGIRCGGTGVSPIVPLSPTGQTPTTSPIGCARHTRRYQLPPASTTHAQEAARVVDGETRGVRGVGWVVGAGARRAGRPGSRRGRKAPGRLPGRLLLWASAPPRLTSCRRCGKMIHEGSHRRRPQRRPSSKVRQKPGRFRNDRALLYPGS